MERKPIACAALILLLSGATAVAQTFDIHAPTAKASAVEIETLSALNTGFRPAMGGLPRGEEALKLGYGLSDWWRLVGFAAVDKPVAGSPQVVGAGVESILVLKPLTSDGIGVGAIAGVQFATERNAATIADLGPLLQWRQGAVTVLVNPLLERAFGQPATSGSALSYLWQARLDVDRRIGVGLEGMGRVPGPLAAPPLALQDHRIGPALFLDLEGAQDRTVEVSIGVQFGVTEASPVATFRFNVGLSLDAR